MSTQKRIPMILNTKFLAFFLLFSVGMFAQENDSIPVYQFSKEDPETVFFDLEIFYPVALGNNLYKDAYSLDPGFAFNVNWFIKPKITVGARFAQFTGHVEDKSLTGNIGRTNFQMIGITAGYFLPFNREWSLQSKIGIAASNYRHTAPEDKFEDGGGQTWLAAVFAYRFDKSLAIFAKASIDYHFNHIEIVADKDDYFNSSIFTQIGIGLRWHLQNPGG